MSVSRSRAVYRVLRHRLPRVITARRKASPRDAVGDGGDAAFAPQRRRDPSSHLALIVGHFSFDDWYATFGDTEAMRIVMSWLDEAGVPFDVACHPVNGLTGVDFWHVDPLQYTIVVFVCGPWNQERHDTILRRFGHCVKIGVNLSVVEPGDHGFDLLFRAIDSTPTTPTSSSPRTSRATQPSLDSSWCTNNLSTATGNSTPW